MKFLRVFLLVALTASSIATDAFATKNPLYKPSNSSVIADFKFDFLLGTYRLKKNSFPPSMANPKIKSNFDKLFNLSSPIFNRKIYSKKDTLHLIKITIETTDLLYWYLESFENGQKTLRQSKKPTEEMTKQFFESYQYLQPYQNELVKIISFQLKLLTTIDGILNKNAKTMSPELKRICSMLIEKCYSKSLSTLLNFYDSAYLPTAKPPLTKAMNSPLLGRFVVASPKLTRYLPPIESAILIQRIKLIEAVAKRISLGKQTLKKLNKIKFDIDHINCGDACLIKRKGNKK